MPTVQDYQLIYLRDNGYSGSLNDMLVQWMKDNGGVSGTFNDLQRQMLLANGGVSGTNNDLAVQAFNAAGYSGTLPDMSLEFWKNGSGWGPPVVGIIPDPFFDTGCGAGNWTCVNGATITTATRSGKVFSAMGSSLITPLNTVAQGEVYTLTVPEVNAGNGQVSLGGGVPVPFPGSVVPQQVTGITVGAGGSFMELSPSLGNPKFICFNNGPLVLTLE